MRVIIFLFVFLFTSNCFSQERIEIKDSNLCESLVKYRDTELFADFKKISRTFELNYQAKSDISNIRRRLVEDNVWQTSNAGNAFAQLMILTDQTCDLILKLIPTSKSVRATLETSKLYNLYSRGEQGKSLIENGTEQFIFDQGMEKMLGELSPILIATQNMLGTVAAMNNLDRDWKSYKQTITTQVTHLDKMIKEYDVKLKQYTANVESINKYKNYIDDYLRKNCGPNIDITASASDTVRETPLIDDDVFVLGSVQKMPVFPGNWAKFIGNYNTPELAKEYAVSGTLYVSWIVEKDGSLTDIQVKNNEVGFGTAEEAIRLLKTSPKWSPGIQNGEPVRVLCGQYIKINIDEN